MAAEYTSGAVARMPGSDETAHLLEFFQAESARFEEDTASAEALVPKSHRLPDASPAVQAAWFEVANILLNLDETITKG